jgi:hypothetical protein
MTVSVAEHCRRIKAHIAKGDKAVEKADEHYKAAGIYPPLVQSELRLSRILPRRKQEVSRQRAKSFCDQ